MKRLNWYFVVGILLFTLSFVLYLLHFFVFKDSHHIFIYFLGDLAFVPIEVLVVTIIIHRMLNMREKRNMMEKLNMVIGAFFNEVGTELMRLLFTFDDNFSTLNKYFLDIQKWSKKDFIVTRQKLHTFHFGININKGELDSLRAFFTAKRDFILMLLQNPNLLEHDTFTDLLWAITHLTEELACRDSCIEVLDSDLEHLAGDMRRAYIILIQEWLDYMNHLRASYPYLFSLAVRMNPFNPEASPVVK
jgi:hypothetical protein